MEILIGIFTLLAAQTFLLLYLSHRNYKNSLEESIDRDFKAVWSYINTHSVNSTKALKALEGRLMEYEEILDTLQEDINMRLNAFQELSNDFLEVIGTQTLAIENIESRIFEPAVKNQPEILQIIKQEEVSVVSREPEETTVENTDNHQTEVSSVEETVSVAPTEQTDVPAVVGEALLKPPRGDNDPLITDLRAVPFEEARDNYGNIHDIPVAGDGYESWGSGGGSGAGKNPRPRGFRRI